MPLVPRLHVHDYARTTLKPRHRAVVSAFAGALFSHDVHIDRARLADFVVDFDRAMSNASKTLRFGLLVMLDVVRLLPLFLLGKLALFDDLSLADRVRMLERMERSSVTLVMLIFVAYKTMLVMLFFEDPAEQAAMGYPGPARERYKRGLPVVAAPRAAVKEPAS